MVISMISNNNYKCNSDRYSDANYFYWVFDKKHNRLTLLPLAWTPKSFAEKEESCILFIMTCIVSTYAFLV